MEQSNGVLNDIPAIIAACKKAGVLYFRSGETEVLFATQSEILTERAKTLPSYGTIKAGSPDPVGEISPDDEADIKQRMLDDLLLTNPELAEDMRLNKDDHVVPGRQERE